MANTLKASVDFNTRRAEQKLDRLLKKINDIQKAVNNTTTSNTKVEQSIRRKVKQEDQFGSSVDNANKKIKKQKNLFTSIEHKIKGLAAAYLGVMGATTMITTSDTITSAENKFNNMNNGDTAATQNQMDKMYASAQKVRMGYADMMTNVGKSMTLASDAFGGNIDNAIRFQEIMAEAYTLGGASAAEQSSSMYQMIQGLGSGILQGDELRSVREGAPLAYKAIEEFAQGIFGAEENLKDLASQGKITSDIVVAAIMNVGSQMDEQFEKTSMTFAQAWKKIKNTAMKAFEPVLQKLNDILNSEEGKKAIEIIGNTLLLLAEVLNVILSILTPIFEFIINNWDVLKWVALAAIVIIIGMIWSLNIAMWKLYWTMTVGILKANMAWMKWTIIITLIIAALYVLYKSSSDVCDFLIKAAFVVASMIVAYILWVAVTSWIATGTITLGASVIALTWVAVILLLIALFLIFMEQIIGGLYGIVSVVGAVCSNIGTFFSNLWYGVTAEFWDFIADMVEGFEWLAKPLEAIAKVFDKEFSAESFVAEARVKATAARGNIGEYVNLGGAWKTGYAEGAAKGKAIKDKINSWGSGLSEKFKDKGLDEKLGLNTSDPATLADIASADGKTADNTGKMADTMELAEEDLSYLKHVAEMEWKKEYTTASIKIDMTNNNTINDSNDWEGWFSKLTDALNEELEASAQGVYSY